MSREPWILLLPENCQRYLTLIWRHVKRTASQNGAIPHINQSIYSIEATSKSCLQLLIAVFLFCWEKAKMMDPVWDSFLFYLRTVQSQTRMTATRVGLVTDMKSDRSEFIFKPVPCKHMERNLLYKHQWNTRWAFVRKLDIFTCENNMLSSHVKISPLLWLCSKVKEFVTLCTMNLDLLILSEQ